jgi:hypothetical protein
MSKTTDEAIATAMVELEDDIYSLSSMAQIVADLIDSLYFDRNPTGGFKVFLTEHERDTIDFAVCNVSARAITLKERFIKATHGEQGS